MVGKNSQKQIRMPRLLASLESIPNLDFVNFQNSELGWEKFSGIKF